MPDTVSLTKILVGIDGKNLKIGEKEKDEERDFTVRDCILIALEQGSIMAQNKEPLSEVEKLNGYYLSKKIQDEDRTGYTFKSKEVTMIRKYANLRFASVIFGALVDILDPGEQEDDAAKSD